MLHPTAHSPLAQRVESSINVTVHPSCFPERWREDYLESFRSRRMNHRFHYESPKQAARWLALHEAFSPARRDPDCEATYTRAFSAVAKMFAGHALQVVSLGCGGGQKDLALLSALAAEGCELSYAPSDVSLPLALTSHRRVAQVFPKLTSHPTLLDLAHTKNLSLAFQPAPARLTAFFGMAPNFEPGAVFPQLAHSLGANDVLLVSANLAPGADYSAGIARVLPGYDNLLTRQWLATVLNDAGIDVAPEDLVFELVNSTEFSPLKRIEAAYIFRRDHSIKIEGEELRFEAGERFRLFFSYRHTPELLAQLLKSFGLKISAEWVTPSGEEGVFLCRRA